VSEESTGTLPDLENVWAALVSQGYALTNDRTVGLTENIREYFREKYFNDSTLRRDDGDRPADRRRARDVIRYQWRDNGLHLQEHDTITITDRGDMSGKRDHARVRILDDPLGEDLVRALLALVPPGRREPDGTFGVNLFRTFTDVVTRPHSDHEPFCVFYVLNRVGNGAETYLYRSADVTDQDKPTADPVLRHQLNPGDIIIFEDKLFKHGATPLEPLADGTAMRDALICTVDHPQTYLGAAAAS
jgi:2OG-Fe dioxygenase